MAVAKNDDLQHQAAITTTPCIAQPGLQIFNPIPSTRSKNMEELVFELQAAAEYDRAFAHVA
jgi:hypothetical protein